VGNLAPKILELVARLSGQEPSPLSAQGEIEAPRRQYREALRRWWGLTAQGAKADRQKVSRTYQELLRLMDEVGEATATRLRRQWAWQWWQETGICPNCGNAGEFHDPAPSRRREEAP
jgi:hypothetical protein